MSQLGLTYPAFVRNFLQKLYVDNYVGGANTKEDAFEFYKKIKRTLLGAGLELRKWVSSDPLLQEKLDETDTAYNQEICYPVENVHEVLEVQWDRRKDCFLLSIYTN